MSKKNSKIKSNLKAAVTIKNTLKCHQRLKKSLKHKKKRVKSRKKINGGGLLSRVLPDLMNLRLSKPSSSNQPSNLGLTGAVLDISKNYGANILSDIKSLRSFLKFIFNFIFKPSMHGAYFTVSKTSNLVFNGLFKNITPGQLASLGMTAGLLSLGALYYHGLQSEKSFRITSSTDDKSVIKLSNLSLDNHMRSDYYDEELLLRYESDPHYSFRQTFDSQKKNKIKIIYDRIKDINTVSDNLDYNEILKRLNDVIDIIKNQPYILREFTDLCSSNQLLSYDNIPLIYCIIYNCNNLRVIKLLLHVHELNTLKISDRDSFLNQIKTSKYEHTVLDYILSKKINDKKDSLLKVKWLSNHINYYNISFQTIILYFKYIRDNYRFQIYRIKKKYTIQGNVFDFLYRNLSDIRNNLIEILNILLLKYSQNIVIEHIDLFDIFIDKLLIEDNLIPLDIQIIECLMTNNFELKLDDKNKKEKLLKLDKLGKEIITNQHGMKVILKIPEIKKSLDPFNDFFKLGEFKQRDYQNQTSVLVGNFTKEVAPKFTTGIHYHLKDNLFYHYHKLKNNNRGYSLTPYVLIPITEQELKYEYLNRKEGLKIFGSLQSAIHEYHHFKVYFLNDKFSLRIVNNFLVYVKKTKKTYVKISIDIQIQDLPKERYYFWILRNDIDFKYLKLDTGKINLSKEITKIKEKKLSINKKIFLNDETQLEASLWSSLLRLIPFFHKESNKLSSLKYKDVLVLTVPEGKSLSQIDKNEDVFFLIKPTDTLEDNEIDRQYALDSYSKQILKSNKTNLQKLTGSKCLQLENGHIILSRSAPDYQEIERFLKSKTKKNLIISFEFEKSSEFKNIRKAIDLFSYTKYLSDSGSLSKSIILITYGDDDSFNNFKRDIEFVDKQQILLPQNKILTHEKLVDIQDFISQQKDINLDFAYDQYRYILTITNKTNGQSRLEKSGDYAPIIKPILEMLQKDQNLTLEKHESVSFFMGEYFLIGDKNEASSGYLAISSTKLN